MPLYQYQCAECEKVKELFRPVAKMDDLVLCENHKHPKPMKRKISKSTFKMQPFNNEN